MRAAWREGGAQHTAAGSRWSWRLIACVWITALATGWPGSSIMRIAMTAGECFTAFFAVWIVHRGTEDHVYPARTQRGWLKQPDQLFDVPARRASPVPRRADLPPARTARRLDKVAPEIAGRQVI